ncbi:DUF6506 family protein [Gelria sp. Kuro-4]|uniref:DUF6506 family protein n=1 Tax=Gelria sp. Kuro-4 TaxID=2796927 RepID=UPI001BEE8527|nr:DUF6506 family protein [Gelria sp. Kuro-4]MDK2928333.1 hypothetical protein [Bacillota bacterium]BCV23459.1 hypothetical protein kuro4_02320 [Gelria sp. Kuro-4]
MALKAAFIFVAPGADPQVNRAVVPSPEVELTVVGVPDYGAAEQTAAELAAAGVKAVELCGGFGHEGAARVARAVAGRAKVGVVRFDCHPGLEGRSGDELFA